jgi:hypothetical protein
MQGLAFTADTDTVNSWAAATGRTSCYSVGITCQYNAHVACAAAMRLSGFKLECRRQLARMFDCVRASSGTPCDQ